MPSYEFLRRARPTNDLPIPIRARALRTTTSPGHLRPAWARARKGFTLELLKHDGLIHTRTLRYPGGLTPRQRYRWAKVRLAVACWGSNN